MPLTHLRPKPAPHHDGRAATTSPLDRQRHRSLGTRTLAALVTIISLGLLGACTSADAQSSQTVDGGTLTVGLGTIPACLDASITPAWNYVGRAVVDTLVEQDATTGDFKPWLASSWEVNDDATAFTFHLRDDVTFSNGEPLTAQDVKSTFDGAISFREREGQGVAAGYLTSYQDSEVVDDHTVTVRFTRSRPSFLQAASEKALGIIWQGSQSGSYEQRCTQGIIGTGAFTVGQNVPHQSVTMVRRTGYNWAPPSAGHNGEAYLDKVTFVEIPETGAVVDSLLADEIDATVEPDVTQRLRITQAGYEISDATVAGIPYSLIPNVRGVLGDVEVRRALQVALDRQEIHEVVYGDGAPIATAPISSPVPGWVDLSSSLAYDPAKAREILQADGWKAGSDGIRVKDGQRLTVRYPFTAESDKILVQLLQSELKKVGIELKAEQLSEGQYTTAFNDDQWDLTRIDFTRADPDALLSGFHPDYLYLNWFDKKHIPELVTALDAETNAPNDTERSTAVSSLLHLMIDDTYTFPLNERSHALAHSPSVTGVTHDIGGWPVFYDVRLTQK